VSITAYLTQIKKGGTFSSIFSFARQQAKLPKRWRICDLALQQTGAEIGIIRRCECWSLVVNIAPLLNNDE
jgi:hypothetical protein